MIKLDPQHMPEKDLYKLLSGAVAPRPIAFVTTSSTVNGAINAAPFSYFNVVSNDPPILSISSGRRKGNMMKDTARNAVANGELVIHISTEEMLGDIDSTAEQLPAARSELELTSLHPVESLKVSVPGIKEAKVRFECVLEQHYEIMNDQGIITTDFLLARVVYIHANPEVYDLETGYILPDALRPAARMAGYDYFAPAAIPDVKRKTPNQTAMMK